ncbi:MAG: hypothetical protein FJX30_01140 [Alphaproteobacteria bacterium]|nr:hypothetical protein [Alphaproteobacteria bacterium]
MKFIKQNLIFLSNISQLLVLIILVLILAGYSEAKAWSGYDYDCKTEIDIGSGNLVREGNLIQFYDSKDDNFHTARVQFVQSVAGGTEVNVIDLDTKKERFFLMY